MIRQSPFEKMQKNNDNNNKNNISNYEQNNPTPNIPPTKNQIQNKNNYNQNNDSFNPPPPKHSPFSQGSNQSQQQQNFFPQNQQNNYDYTAQDEDYTQIKNEFETKIKPLNCSSEYISTSANIFPSNIQTLNNLSLPLSVSLCPMKNTGLELPLINYGENNIPRCPNRNCRAYLNPFVKFISGGEKWICNFCGQINNTEEYYYSDVDKNGERLDINQKEELCNGSYEFFANKSYWKKGKTPTEAMFLFIFETSMGAIDNGFFSACIESVKDAISNEIFYNGNNVKISIITYNLGVDFYSYNEKYTQPQMLTVNDEEMFLPTNKNNLIFSLQKDKDKILQTLDLIQNTFNRNNPHIVNNNCKDSTKIFSAIVGAYLIGKNLGGKLILFSSSNILSTNPFMNGGLDKNMTKEQIAYSALDNKKLRNIGINLTNENMGCDIFASADSQINTITLNQVCEYTNGHLYFFKKFNIDLHYKNIFNQIRKVLTRPIAWEGVNRTRFSSGYRISSYSSPILITNGDLFIFPTTDSDQNYSFCVSPPPDKTEEGGENENKNMIFNNAKKENYIYIQSALLYSYGDGTRRIRIHNLCLPLSTNIGYIYNEVNAESLATHYLKDTIDKIYKTKNISNAIISTDTQFKHFIDKVMANNHKMNKELLPNLDYLPLYMIGMFKHRIFCKEEIEKNYDIDISNFLRISLQKLYYQEILTFILPSIYSLHELENDKNIGTYNSETGEFNMPSIISSSKSAMEENGLYLIDNGYLLIIYIKKNISTYILQNLFGIDNLDSLTMIITEENIFGENNSNEFKDRIRNILDYIRGGKSLFQNLIFVFEGKGGERIINESLIEDNYCQWFPMNYANFYKKYIKENTTSFGY
jgi:protein transport protein SEC24